MRFLNLSQAGENITMTMDEEGYYEYENMKFAV